MQFRKTQKPHAPNSGGNDAMELQRIKADKARIMTTSIL